MLRPPPSSLGRCRCLGGPRCRGTLLAPAPPLRPSHRPDLQLRASLWSRARPPPQRPLNPLDAVGRHRAAHAERAQHLRGMYYAGGGLLLSLFGTFVLVSVVPPGPRTVDRAEAAPAADPLASAASEHAELVKTSSDAVPFFPRTITLPGEGAPTASAALPVGTGQAPDEYQLVGLGVRTVSFLSIKVYVVGLYVARKDVATLQARFVAAGAGVEGASALVAGERDALRRRLGDPEEGPELWDAILKDGGIRSALRVVPTRGTDFAHLRDGWLRGIQSRTGAKDGGEKFDDEAFGGAVDAFKQILGRGSLGKGRVLVLSRSATGDLTLWVQEGEEGLAKMGSVADERVSRLIWLGYLGGKRVSSEEARSSIIDGVMDMVGRPVGTVESQVV